MTSTPPPAEAVCARCGGGIRRQRGDEAGLFPSRWVHVSAHVKNPPHTATLVEEPEADAPSQAGLYEKFTVFRNDGRDREGGDRVDARYFVLDYIHDPYARQALSAYANGFAHETPAKRELCNELRRALIDTSDSPAALAVIAEAGARWARSEEALNGE